jgi:hypothetical protein
MEAVRYPEEMMRIYGLQSLLKAGASYTRVHLGLALAALNY